MGAPNPDVEELLAHHFSVLPKEIELAEPHVVVFFTGRTKNDGRLKSAFPGIQFHPVKGVEPAFLCELTDHGVKNGADGPH